MLYNIVLHMVSYAGLVSGILAFLYGFYCLVRTMGTGMRIAARLDALWLVPLGILGLDRLFQSEARRALKHEARGWMWRSMFALVLSGVGFVVWAGANPSVKRTCSAAALDQPKGTCTYRAKLTPVAPITNRPPKTL